MKKGGVDKPATEVAIPAGTLAERINAEHHAVRVALTNMVEHAMAAGDLLIEAKADKRNRPWEVWVVHNCDFSLRTAQVYMQLARRRDEIERERAQREKAQSSAHWSIADALRTIAGPPRPEIIGGPDPLPRPTPDEEEIRKKRERERQRLYALAEFAWRTGNHEAPAGVPIGTWEYVLHEVEGLRIKNAPIVLDALGHQLDLLSSSASPEEVAEYLTGPSAGYYERVFRELLIGNREDAEQAAGDLVEELRAGAEWLNRVLEALDEHLEPAALEGEPQQTDDPLAD